MDKTDFEALSERSSGSDASSYASSFDDDESVEDRNILEASPGSGHGPAGATQEAPSRSVQPAAGQLSPKRLPKPKIPALGLRPDLSRGLSSATPRSHQESARGRPAVAIPRLPRPYEDAAMQQPTHHEPVLTASLSSTGAVAIAAGMVDGCDGDPGAAGTVTVGLLSPALVLSSKQGDGPLPARVLATVGAALGVPQQEMKLFEVRELPEAAQLASDTACIAVAVNNSGMHSSSLKLRLWHSCAAQGA